MTENEALLRLQYMYDSDKSFMVGRRKEIEMAMQAIKENQQYHAIGTVEEFKALKEKAEPKKPIRNDLCTCPSCGTHNEVIKKRRNTVVRDTVYCWHCGQAIECQRDIDLD